MVKAQWLLLAIMNLTAIPRKQRHALGSAIFPVSLNNEGGEHEKLQIGVGFRSVIGVVIVGRFCDSITLMIGTPPPAPVVEAMPVAPGPQEDYAWRPGYWRWIDERHVRISGDLAHRPHPKAEWQEPRWEKHPEGYHFEEGHWK